MNQSSWSTSKPFEISSWQTAISEADDIIRWLGSASDAAGSLMGELLALRNSADVRAREAVAQALVTGSDGGALALLSDLAGAATAPTDAPRIAQIILDRLCVALSLIAVGERGHQFRATIHDSGAFDVLGLAADEFVEGQTYRILRQGWRLGTTTLAVPLIEPVTEDEWGS